MEYRKELFEYIETLVARNASDLHLISDAKPTFRVYRELNPFIQKEALIESDVESFLGLITENLNLDSQPLEYLKKNKKLLFSYKHKTSSEKILNFRCTAYLEGGRVAIAMRLIHLIEKSLEDLNLPPILGKVMESPQGLFLVTGPSGNGKSTALAAMINHLNNVAKKHILTIEDPIEYIFSNKKSIITQLEIPSDGNDFRSSVDLSLRTDSDVIMIGEMREVETIKAMMTAAEVGHLALSTVHSNSAYSTIDRIVDSFEAGKQKQIANQLSGSLLGVCSIRLLPRISGGLIPACEILLNNNAVSNLIREGRTAAILTAIQTGSDQGMISLEKSLADLVKKGEITLDVAHKNAPDKRLVERYL